MDTLQMIQNVYNDSNADALERLVHIWMLVNADTNGQIVSSSQPKMAEHIGIGITTLKQRLKRLEQRNVIHVQRHYDQALKMFTTANTYTVVALAVQSRPDASSNGGVRRETSSKDVKVIKNINTEQEHISVCPVEQFLDNHGITVPQFQIAIWKRYGSAETVIAAIQHVINRFSAAQFVGKRGYVTAVIRNGIFTTLSNIDRDETVYTSAPSVTSKRLSRSRNVDHGVATYIERLRRVGL